LKRSLVLVLVISMIMATIAGCAPQDKPKEPAGNGGAGEETPKAIEMFVAGTSGAEDTQSMAHVEFGKRLEEASDGGFKVEVKINGVMGETDDVTEQAIQGVPVINASDPGRLAAYVPEYGLIQMPYIFPDYTYLNKVMQTELYKKWEKDFEAKGLKLVTSNGYSGVRSWITNMPVEKPADLKGVKIRTIGSDLFVNSINAMGAVATAVDWGETYQAIEQKVVDGTEAQIPGIYSMRFYEILSHVSLSEHFTLIASMVTGTKFFDSLSEENQNLLMTTAFDTYKDNQELVVELSDKYITEMEGHGVTFVEIDKTPFIEAVEPVYEKMGFVELRDELYKELGL